MFKCEKCGNDSAPSERPTKVVIATRKKEYLACQRMNGTHDRGGTGSEIVQEVTVHEQCADDVRATVAAAAARAQEAIAKAEEAAASPVVYTDSGFNGVRVA